MLLIYFALHIYVTAKNQKMIKRLGILPYNHSNAVTTTTNVQFILRHAIVACSDISFHRFVCSNSYQSIGITSFPKEYTS